MSSQEQRVLSNFDRPLGNVSSQEAMSLSSSPQTLSDSQPRLDAQRAVPANSINLSQVPSSIGTQTTSSPNTQHNIGIGRVKRFRFSERCDLLLLQAVALTGAHLAPHGEKMKRFEESLSSFVQAAKVQSEGYSIPTCRTFISRFDNLIRKRRLAVRVNNDASGISENITEKDSILDDMILEIDDYLEQKQEEEQNRSATEAQLVEAGRAIRELACNRQVAMNEADDINSAEISNEPQDSEDRIIPNDEVTPPRRKRRRRSSVAIESDEECNRMFLKEMKLKRESEDKRTELEKQRLEIEINNSSRWERNAEIQMRRIDIDEKRLEMDRIRHEAEEKNRTEERKALEKRLELDRIRREAEEKSRTEERNAFVEVLKAMAGKLR